MGYCLSGQQASTSGGGREARRSGALYGVVQTQVFKQRGVGQLDDV